MFWPLVCHFRRLPWVLISFGDYNQVWSEASQYHTLTKLVQQCWFYFGMTNWKLKTRTAKPWCFSWNTIYKLNWIGFSFLLGDSVLTHLNAYMSLIEVFNNADIWKLKWAGFILHRNGFENDSCDVLFERDQSERIPSTVVDIEN